MKRLVVRLAVALVTFAVGVGLSALEFRRDAPRMVVEKVVLESDAVGLQPAGGARGGCTMFADRTPDAKAVRLAEEFVARNGYTDLPADRENLSSESVEWESNVDEILRLRHDSLERRAYGLRYSGKMGRPGWTVVFRYKERSWAANGRAGRAVTMDENFGNIRVEHKDFLPAGVEKKL
jgi:hypothetical protein